MVSFKNEWYKYLFTFLSGSLLSGVIFYWIIIQKLEQVTRHSATPSIIFPVSHSCSPTPQSCSYTLPTTSFQSAADSTINSVVYISTQIEQDSFFSLRDLFGGKAKGTGSGVIISKDGYIVTNYHVVEKAAQVWVKLNDNSEYFAEIIATDPNTDLAVLKIDAQNLRPIKMGNSDHVKIGEWVLAVGNPFNLNSTVTAGIVSAKARNIGILRNHIQDKYGTDYSIESFIQTDAAVNPGNSGGALVNLAGELVGINTAIATETGSYAGYSFAIPVNLVKKVIMDLITYGAVQRGFIGVNIRDVDAKLAQEYELPTKQGALIVALTAKGAARLAGLQKGDLIVAINDKPIRSASELQEQIANYRPGDQVIITYLRKSSQFTTAVVLRNAQGNLNFVEPRREAQVYFEKLGATLAPASPKELTFLAISKGIKVVDLKKSSILYKSGIQKNFIICQINGHAVKSLSQMYLEFAHGESPILLEGFYPDGKRAQYEINFNETDDISE